MSGGKRSTLEDRSLGRDLRAELRGILPQPAAQPGRMMSDSDNDSS